MANEIRDEATSVFRNFVTNGIPSSGANKPSKSEIRDLFTTINDKAEAHEALIDTANVDIAALEIDIAAEAVARQAEIDALDARVVAAESIAAAGVHWITQTVRVRSTANVDIATGLENGDTLNGITLATGDNVFLGSQTNQAQNGLYTVVAFGAAPRATFADSASELAHIGFAIQAGTVGTGEGWTLPLDTADITIGTTNLVFAQIPAGAVAEVQAARGTASTLAERVDSLLPRSVFDPVMSVLMDNGIFSPAFAFYFGQTGAWLDFSDTGTLYQDTGATIPADSDGDPIALIEDKSGGGYNYQQSTAGARPLYKAEILNELGVARFDGVDDILAGVSATLGLLNGKTGATIFAVLNHAVITGTSRVALAFTRNGANNISRAALSLESGVWQATVRNFDASTAAITAIGTATSVPASQWKIHEAAMDMSGTGIVQGRINGDLVGLGSGAPAPFPSTNSNASSIGGLVTSLMQGDIAEIVIYVGDITEEVRNLTYSYLSQKWGIAYEDPELFETDAGPVSGAWTWFNDPRVAYLGADHFAVGAIHNAGRVVIADLDGDDYQQSLPAHTFHQRDDHDNPAIIKLASGYLLAAYCGHTTATSIFVVKSTNTNDASAWGTPLNLDASFGHSSYSYANLIQLDSGRIYFFFRAINATTTDYAWHYSYSDDDGVTWVTGVQISETNRPYHKFRKNGANRIDIIRNDGHPDAVSTNGTYHLYLLDTAGVITFHKSDGSVMGSPPFAGAACTEIYNATTGGGRSWIWDVVNDAGLPVVTFARFPGATATVALDHRYHQARWNGSAWVVNEICAAGGELYAAQDFYSGGVITDPSDIDTVYCSRKVDSNGVLSATGVHQLFRYVTANGGTTWTGTQLTFGALPAIRPYIPDGSSKLFYVTGRYTTYTDYDTEIAILDI